MKLISLKFKNFCGFKDFLFEPNGDDVVVYGDNGTGKTTIYNGFLWLLFDKNSEFKSMNPKPLDENGKEIPGLENTVEGVLEINGKEFALKKTMRELWVKKRGTGNKVFSGHETSYWIDDVPCSQRKYKNTVASFAHDAETFKLLSSPYYFSTIVQWKQRRDTLMDIVGDVTVEDVVQSVRGLSEVPKLIGDKYSVDEYSQLVGQRISAMNRELKEIPIRIDEAEANKVDERTLKAKATITKEIKALKQQLLEIRTRRQEIKDEQSNTNLRRRIREVELERAEILSEAESKVREEIFKLRDKVSALDIRMRKYQQVIEASDRAKDRLADIEIKLGELRKEYARVKESEFTPSEDEVICGECGQEIPLKLQQAAFMVRKSNTLASVNREGRSLKEKTAGFKADVAAGDEAMIEVKKLQAEINDLNYKIEHNREIDEEYKKRIAEKDAEIERLKSGEGVADGETLRKFAEEDEQLKAEIEEVKAEHEALVAMKRTYESNKRIDARIDQLMKEEKKLAKDIEEYERQKYLLEKFTKAKVSILEGKLEDALKFPGLSIKMFSENINGGLVECCEVLYNGIPFNGGLNHSAQIAVGMKLVNLLSKHYEMQVPLFIDNSEAITSVPKIDTQIILLQVSNEYPDIRVIEIPVTDATM